MSNFKHTTVTGELWAYTVRNAQVAASLLKVCCLADIEPISGRFISLALA